MIFQIFTHLQEQLQKLSLSNLENQECFKLLLEKNEINLAEIHNIAAIFIDQNTLNHRSKKAFELFLQLYQQKNPISTFLSVQMNEIQKEDFLNNYFELWGFVKQFGLKDLNLEEKKQNYIQNQQQYVQQLIDVFNQFSYFIKQDQLKQDCLKYNMNFISQQNNIQYFSSEDEICNDEFSNSDNYSNDDDNQEDQYEDLQKLQFSQSYRRGQLLRS